jgi:two-component system, OmpR family, response regulator
VNARKKSAALSRSIKVASATFTGLHPPLSPSIAVRLLLVEDQPHLLRQLTRILREAGYAVDATADGADALARAIEIDYDALVLDVLLSGLDGWTVLRRLRERKATPVLMLTARDATRDRVRGLDEGADDYLTKPFEPDELLARLRVVIRRGVGKSATLDLGAVRVDTSARVVTLDGAPVPLTPREYALVEYLAQHRGRLVTRAELYEHLYGEEDSTLSNLLNVQVSNIRKKLGADFITTRRGHGYLIA